MILLTGFTKRAASDEEELDEYLHQCANQRDDSDVLAESLYAGFLLIFNSCSLDSTVKGKKIKAPNRPEEGA